jgi:hypothetical protein
MPDTTGVPGAPEHFERGSAERVYGSTALARSMIRLR